MQHFVYARNDFNCTLDTLLTNNIRLKTSNRICLKKVDSSLIIINEKVLNYYLLKIDNNIRKTRVVIYNNIYP